MSFIGYFLSFSTFFLFGMSEVFIPFTHQVSQWASKKNLGNLSNVSFVFSNFCPKCKHVKVGQSMMFGFKVKVAIKYVLM